MPRQPEVPEPVEPVPPPASGARWRRVVQKAIRRVFEKRKWGLLGNFLRSYNGEKAPRRVSQRRAGAALGNFLRLCKKKGRLQ